jgi:hypothetical protein
MTCIGNSPEEAQRLFDETALVMDNSTSSDVHGAAAPMNDRYIGME